MGGRGASSASSRTASTGSSFGDSVISEMLRKYKDIDPSATKLRERNAQKTLSSTSSTPIQALRERAKALVDMHERNIRESADFKKDIARREKQIEKETQLMKSWSKETRTVTNVRGEQVPTNTKRYEVQAKKVTMLNKALNNAYKEQASREKAIKNFKDKTKSFCR